MPASSAYPRYSSMQSLQGWVKPGPIGSKRDIVTLRNNTPGYYTQFRITATGKLELAMVGDVIMVTGSTTLSPGTWYLVTYTWDGTNHRLYINGTQDGATTTAWNGSDAANDYGHIGSYGGGEFFNGSIDDVRIYNRALSSSEINQMATSYDSQINLNSSPTANTSGGNINQGLVGYWPFAGNAKDATPYSNNGTITGATLTSDRKGQTNSAYSFNGTGIITYADKTEQDIGVGQARSISFWMKASPQTASNKLMVGKYMCAGWYFSLMTTGYIVAEFDRDNGSCGGYMYESTIADDKRYDDNTWHHVAGIFDRSGSTMELFVDGVFKSSSTITSAGSGSAVAYKGLHIGAYNSGNMMLTGTLDDVRIYNRALSATEVQMLYNAAN